MNRFMNPSLCDLLNTGWNRFTNVVPLIIYEPIYNKHNIYEPIFW